MKFKDIAASAEKNNKIDDFRDSFVTLIAGALSRPLNTDDQPPNAEHIANAANAAAYHALCRLHEDLPYEE